MDEVTHLSWQRILQWYNNHTRGTFTGDGKRKKILDLRGKRHRKLADWQAYSRLYYNDRIKDVVDREWEAKTKAFMESRAEGDESAVPVLTMAFRNKSHEGFSPVNLQKSRQSVRSIATKRRRVEPPTLKSTQRLRGWLKPNHITSQLVPDRQKK